MHYLTNKIANFMLPTKVMTKVFCFCMSESLSSNTIIYTIVNIIITLTYFNNTNIIGNTAL